MLSTNEVRQIVLNGLSQHYLTKSWPTYDGKELDRSQFLTASEATKCHRALLGQKTQPDLVDTNGATGLFVRGHAVEEAIANGILAGLPPEYELHNALDYQVSYYDDELGLSATPDGILIDHKNAWAFGLEIKSMDPRTAAHNLPRDSHKVQVRIGQELIAECWEDASYRIDPAIWALQGTFLVYVNASDYSDLHTFFVEPWTKSTGLKVYTDKARWLREAIANGDDWNTAPPTGAAVNECRMCPLAHACTARSNGVPASIKGAFNTKPVAPTGAKDIDALFSTYDILLRAEKAAKDRVAPVKAEVMEAVMSQGEDATTKKRVLRGTKFEAAVNTVNGAFTWDAGKLNKLLGDDAEQYKKQGAASLRLDFKPTGEVD